MMAHCSLGAREQIKVTFESIFSNIFASIKNVVNQTAAILLGSQNVKLLRYQNGPVRLAKVFNGRWLVGCAAQWKLWEGLPGIQSPLGSICKNFNVSRHSFAASLYSKTAKISVVRIVQKVCTFLRNGGNSHRPRELRKHYNCGLPQPIFRSANHPIHNLSQRHWLHSLHSSLYVQIIICPCPSFSHVSANPFD